MIMPFSITNFIVICFYSSNRFGPQNDYRFTTASMANRYDFFRF